jgi:plastocyanin
MVLRGALVVAFLTLSLGACAGDAPPSDTASREQVVETTATVEAVNADTREVMISTADGRQVTVEASEAVRNFDRIEVGDTVRMTFVESVAAQMTAVDATGEPTATDMVARAPEGERPAGLVGSRVETVVTFERFDPATDTVTFTTPDGLTHSLVVEPAMRDFAMRREPGDRVRVTYTVGLAIAVEETGG